MIAVGQTYVAKNQGRAITPQSIKVVVVWIENGHVHYRKEGDTVICQTPIDRFGEIIASPSTQ